MRETSDSLYVLAWYWALAGNKTTTLDHLRRCLDRGGLSASPDIDRLAADPEFASMYADPGFQGLLAEARRRVADHR
jgi:hypothetical protein